jgi:hypothetical protein
LFSLLHDHENANGPQNHLPALRARDDYCGDGGNDGPENRHELGKPGDKSQGNSRGHANNPQA